jgi:hypothetical protein
MATVQDSKTLAAGVWKFGPNISRGELIALAKEWMDEPNPMPGTGYVHLCVRGTSPTTFGIQFVYRYVMIPLPEVPNHANFVYRKWLHKMSDQLKRRFGNDLLGWDMDHSILEIKKEHMPALVTSNRHVSR